MRVEFIPKFARGAVGANCRTSVHLSAALVILWHDIAGAAGGRAGGGGSWRRGSRRGRIRGIVSGIVSGNRGGSRGRSRGGDFGGRRDGSRGGSRAGSCGGSLGGGSRAGSCGGSLGGSRGGSRGGRGIGVGAAGFSVPDSRAWNRVDIRVVEIVQYSRVIVGVPANEVKRARRGQRAATADLELRARRID